jgi:hypothetical protein
MAEIAAILNIIKVAKPFLEIILPAIRNNPASTNDIIDKVYKRIPLSNLMPIKPTDLKFLVHIISTAKFTEEDYNNATTKLSKIDPETLNNLVKNVSPGTHINYLVKQHGGNRNTFKVSNPMYILATTRKHMYLI